MVDITINKNQTLDAMLHQILNQALVLIKADAGSLMLVDNDQKLLQIKARLGKPRKRRKTEPVFELKDTSVAGHVALTCKSYLCKDIQNENEKFFRPSRTGVNFRSILSVPIIFSDQAIAIINADSEKANFFEEKHLSILKKVAEKASKPISEKSNITSVIADIGMDLIRLPYEGDAELLLKKIADAAVKALGADVVTLYQYDQDKNEFLVKNKGPTVAGKLNYPEFMRTQVYDTDVPYIFVENRESGFFPNVDKNSVLSGKINRDEPIPRARFIEREGIASMAALLLPYRAVKDNSQEIVGIIFANYREPHAFMNIDERIILSSFADFAAATILNARLEQKRTNERIALVSSLSGALAHRMSRLFSPSKMAVQYLHTRLSKDDEIGHNLLFEVEQQANLLFGLSDKITDRFIKTGTPNQLLPLHLQEEIEKVIARDNYKNKKILINNKVRDDIPKIECDPYQLPHILTDIIDNSCEAIEVLQNSKNKIDGKIEIDAEYIDSSNTVELEVTDNGCGIPEEILNEIFLPGKGTKGTLGIGLWWCQTFLQGIGGDVLLKNPQPNNGTTIIMKLPCVKMPTFCLPNKIERKNKILIVEDNPKQLGVLIPIIKENGYKIEVADNLDSALSILENFEYPLIILDLSLTHTLDDKQGIEILKMLKEQCSFSRVIINSGFKKLADNSLYNQYSNIENIFIKHETEYEQFIKAIDKSIEIYKNLIK